MFLYSLQKQSIQDKQYSRVVTLSNVSKSKKQTSFSLTLCCTKEILCFISFKYFYLFLYYCIKSQRKYHKNKYFKKYFF